MPNTGLEKEAIVVIIYDCGCVERRTKDNQESLYICEQCKEALHATH